VPQGFALDENRIWLSWSHAKVSDLESHLVVLSLDQDDNRKISVVKRLMEDPSQLWIS
jgi:hypothetical protein